MDIKSIQAKLDQIQNPQKGKNNKNNEEKLKHFVKLGVGKHLIRFVPLQANPDNPFIELYFHYGFGKRTIISPVNFGEKDPIVEFAKNLKKSKEPEDWKLAKKLEPKMRVFAPVVVRGEESKGVRFYEFGKQVYTELMALAADEEVGDFTDVMEGRDIKLEVVQGPVYTESTLRPSMKSSPLSKDAAEMEALLGEQVDPSTFYKRYTFDEIKTFLEEWLNPEDEKEVTTEKSQAFPPPFESGKTEAVKVKKEAVTENEFDELFKE